MNAYELEFYKIASDKLADIVSQQADRIAELEKENFNKENPVKEAFNKPVAWLRKDGSFIHIDPRVDVIDPDLTPLYTHPVKQLTLEKLEDLYRHSHGNTEYMRAKSFMRAIIKEIT